MYTHGHLGIFVPQDHVRSGRTRDRASVLGSTFQVFDFTPTNRCSPSFSRASRLHNSTVSQRIDAQASKDRTGIGDCLPTVENDGLLSIGRVCPGSSTRATADHIDCGSGRTQSCTMSNSPPHQTNRWHACPGTDQGEGEGRSDTDER